MSQQLITSNEISPTSGVANTGIVGTIVPNQGGTGLSTVGTNGQVLTSNGTTLGWVTPTAVTPGGSTSQVQFNSSGSFGGSANLTFDGSTLTTLNSAYTGTLTGGTGIVNLGSGQVYKDASGNVGIGTNIPVTRLHVNSAGDATFNSQVLIAPASGGNPAKIAFNPTVSSGIAGLSDGTLAFYGNGANSERLRIDSSGNVLVNASTLPTALNTNFKNIYVKGASNGVVVASSNDGLASVTLYSGANSTDNPAIAFQNSLRFATATDVGIGGFAERMRITSAGAISFGPSGTATGTLGQVLTSGGSSASPTWVTALGGAGQTWQNFTGSRSLGTNYTNSTGGPIMIVVSLSQNTNGIGHQVYVQSQTFNAFQCNGGASGISSSSYTIVPNGATFQISAQTGESIGNWMELRP